MPEVNPELERRSCPRLKPNSVLLAQYASVWNPVRDISPEGAFIEDSAHIPPGQRFPLKLWLNAEAIAVHAVVRRQVAGQGMGVEFQGMSGQGYRALCQYCGVPPRLDL